MLELGKRHLRKCPKHAPGSPFSADLDCKRCVYYAFGKLNGKKVRQSLDTTDRQEAASRLLKIEAEAQAPFKYTMAEAVKKFLTERENSGHQPKSILRYQYSLERLATFLAGKGVTQLRAVLRPGRPEPVRGLAKTPESVARAGRSAGSETPPGGRPQPQIGSRKTL